MSENKESPLKKRDLVRIHGGRKDEEERSAEEGHYTSTQINRR